MKKIRKYCYKKLNQSLPRNFVNNLQMIYSIRPHLDYGDIIYDQSNVSNVSCLDK